MSEANHTLDPDCLELHLDALYRSARGLCGSALDAEDLVQKMLARVLAKPRRVRRGDELPYLMVALRHVFYDWRRSASRRPIAAMQPEDEGDLRSLLDLPEQRAETSDVLRAVSELPAPMRDALIAVDRAGFMYHEAAAMLGVTKATVAGRVFRARARIAAQFDPAAEPLSEPENRSAISGVIPDMPKMHPAIELITEPEDGDSPELTTEAIEPAPAPQISPPPAALYYDGRVVPVPASGAVVGRSVSCDVRLDLPSVSRRHAWIRPANGGWAVHDLDSTNGVSLNGAVLDSPQWLRHGDALQIGRAQVTFVASVTGAQPVAA